MMVEDVSRPASRAELTDPLESLLGYQLRRASSAMLADLASHMAALDVRVVEASVLLLVEANADVTQSAIGRALNIQRANMAPLAANLTSRGLIVRSRVDGRSHGLRVSPAGSTLAVEIRACIAASESRFLVGFSSVARNELVALLRRIWKAPL